MVQLDPRFGATLRTLRTARGLSLRKLGERVFSSHGHLWDIEHGRKSPSAELVVLLDQALSADGRLSGLVLSGQVSGIASVVGRTDAFDPSAFLAPALRWITAPGGQPDTWPDTAVVDGRLMGQPDIELVRQLLDLVRTADNRLGGGHVHARAVRLLRHDVGELLAGRCDTDTRRSALTLAAEASQIVGWTAFDSGAHGTAQRAMIDALDLAGAAGDAALGAEILAAMSHQASHLRAHREAVDLARSAGRAAADAGVGAIQAEAAVLEAQGHAVAGNAAASAAALDRAERLFDRAERGSDPQWLGYFDASYLSARFGQTFAALGRGDLALPFAERSLAMDGARYARGRMFNLALVARAHAQTGAVEEAAIAGLVAAEAAEGLASRRAHDYLAEVAARLAPHAGLEPVAQFRARVRELVSR